MTDERGQFQQAPNQTTIVDDADALAAAQNALQAAQAAMARANSAMQRANTAATDAGNANVTLGQLQAAQAAADATHDTLAAEDAVLAARLDQIQLTPGPQGEPGQDGQDGAAGKSAYQVARDHGYGGTETQWLATLVGAKGDPGVPGASIKGDKGDTGAPGANAIAPTLSLGTVTTLAAGATANASMGGTPQDRILNLGIPIGNTGLSGSNGSNGLPGTPGTNGSNATVVIASGWASTPLLALGAQQDITITLSRAMPSTSYNVEVNMPTALLGVSLITVKSKTTTTVVLTLKANVAIGASSLGVTTWASL